MSTTTGTVDFVVGSETFQTWYKVQGDLKSGVPPLVLIHGGPGIPHQYLLSHAALHKDFSIPVIWYDQLGCGNSTHLPHKGKDFWTIELFMDELENLLAKLGVATYDILGHSWGGMFGVTWVATRAPAGLRRVVLVGSPASAALWEEVAAGLVAQLPDDARAAIQKHGDAGEFEHPEYQAAVQVYYTRHLCRTDPWAPELLESLEALTGDSTVYNTMWGPNEFSAMGTLKTWSAVDIVHKIKQPTLVVNGLYDQAQDSACMPFFNNIPKVKWVQFAESSHMPFLEEPERYHKILGEFLTAA